MKDKDLYKIIFYNQNKIYEIYVRQVYQSDLWGFIEVEQFVFDTQSEIVIDPAEERLKTEFTNVKRTYIPMNSVIRIDEVSKKGTVKIKETKLEDKVMPFPSTYTKPPIKSDE